MTRDRLLRAWARGVVRRRRAILWTAAVATGLALVLATRLEMRAGRIDLLGEDDPVAQAWLDYAKDFGSPNGIVLLVGGADAARRRAAVDAITARLLPHRGDLYRSVLFRVDPHFRTRYGAYYADRRAVNNARAMLAPFVGDDARPTWSGIFTAWDRQLNRRLHAGLETGPGDASLSVLERLSEAWATTVDTGAPPEPDALGPTDGVGADLGVLAVDAHGYLVSQDGAFHLVLISPTAVREDAAAYLMPFMETIRAASRAARAADPTIVVHMTGLSAYAFTDLQVMQHELPYLTLLAAIGVLVVFRVALGGLRAAAQTGLCMGLALAWTLGLTALVVGHLTLLSSVFGLLLIGLGIDYGIHLVARYQHHRRRFLEPEAALVETYTHGVNGILTGGVTTAVAFALCGVADFQAFAELGVITAIGITCNLVAMLVVLPALLAGGARPVSAPRLAAAIEGGFGALGRALDRRAWVGAALAVPLVLWAVPRSGRVPFDFNFLHMQPADTPFPMAEHLLETRTTFAPQFDLVLADDPAEAAHLAAALRAAPSVRAVLHAGSVLPRADTARDAAVARLRDTAARATPPAPPNAAELDAVARTLDRVRARLTAYERTSFAIRNKAVLADLERTVRMLDRLHAQRLERPADVWRARTATFLAALGDAWTAVARDCAELAPAPPGVDDLPPDVVARFRGRSGRLAVAVVPRASLWDHDALLAFNADVATVTPTFTGMGALLEHLIGQAAAAPRDVGLWVGAFILAVLALDFRRPAPVLAAAATLVLGIAALLATMDVAGLAFTPMNVLSFPLLMGIGIDNSVHVLHGFREEDPPTAEQVLRRTGPAMLLAALTTLVGFGSLALSSHRGLAGFGVVLAIGVITCLLTAVVILPGAWVLWLRARRALRPADAAPRA